MYAGFDIKNELGTLFGYLPRELRKFQKILYKSTADNAANKDYLINCYLTEASTRFKAQLNKVLRLIKRHRSA